VFLLKALIDMPLQSEQGEDKSRVPVIRVELDRPLLDPNAYRLVANTPDHVVIQAIETFDSAMDNIREVANSVALKLRQVSDDVDEATIKFGMKFGVEGKIYVASAKGEASFEVELKWKRETAPPAPVVPKASS
jgi:hypothetical protein